MTTMTPTMPLNPTAPARLVAVGTSLAALTLTGALFGFFYAWVCSTMWGLDAADPRTAIAAMQAMNASVRNAVFFPVFFLTAPALALAGLAGLRAGGRVSSGLMFVAAVIVALGCFVLTMTVNVPMNEALGGLAVPEDVETAAQIWAEYSPRWQVFNTLRTIAAGSALTLGGAALWKLPG